MIHHAYISGIIAEKSFRISIAIEMNQTVIRNEISHRYVSKY